MHICVFQDWALQSSFLIYLIFFFILKAHSCVCRRMLRLAECSTSLGENTSLKHTSIIIRPKRLCYSFSTLPGFVLGVHVILFVMLNASLARILERILSRFKVQVWVSKRKEASFRHKQPSYRDKENLCYFSSCSGQQWWPVNNLIFSV